MVHRHLLRRCILRLLAGAVVGAVVFWLIFQSDRDIKPIIDRVLDGVVATTNDNVYRPNSPDCSIQKSWMGSAYAFPPSCDMNSTDDAVATLCSSLAGKEILLVGPETTYYLHTLWLGAVGQHENRTIMCRGPRWCNAHQICRSKRGLATNASVRYVQSTSLYAGRDAKDEKYKLPQIDTETGIRVRNGYWVGHAGSSNVVVMNRGPIPAPAWTYTNTKRGNWTFAEALYSNSSTRYIEGRKTLGRCVVNAALHNTLTKFLPSVKGALKEISFEGKLLVWHLSWYLQQSCAGQGLFLDVLDGRFYTDPWTQYYNAQVYMQNRLMQRLVTQYDGHVVGIALPDEETLSTRVRGAWECLFDPVQSGVIGQSFLNGLARLM